MLKLRKFSYHGKLKSEGFLNFFLPQCCMTIPLALQRKLFLSSGTISKGLTDIGEELFSLPIPTNSFSFFTDVKNVHIGSGITMAANNCDAHFLLG